RPRELGCRDETERFLARLRVGNTVRDRAGGARAGGERDSLVEGRSLRRSFQTAVLVEEACVDMEDAVADDVKAEVTGFDYAGVDRSDRDLVRVMPPDRHGPALEPGVVVDE